MNRDERFDFYKGLLMFGVLWGHSITALLGGDSNNIGIHWILRTYDMPFFMLISGYFLSFSIRKYGFLKLCLDKFTTLLIPSVLWSLLASLGHKADTYYFLNAVFSSSVIMIVLSKIPMKYVQILGAMGITTFFHYTRHFAPFNMAYLFPYFAIGFFTSGIKKNGIASAVMAFCWIPMLCYWNTDFTIWSTRACLIGGNTHLYLVTLFRFMIGLCGIAFSTMAFDMLYDSLQPRRNWFCRLMVECGKETLGLYILQQIAIFGIIAGIVDKVVSVKGYNPVNFNENLLGYVFAPVVSLILLYLLLRIIRVTKEMRYTKWIWGMKIRI